MDRLDSGLGQQWANLEHGGLSVPDKTAAAKSSEFPESENVEPQEFPQPGSRQESIQNKADQLSSEGMKAVLSDYDYYLSLPEDEHGMGDIIQLSENPAALAAKGQELQRGLDVLNPPVQDVQNRPPQISVNPPAEQSVSPPVQNPPAQQPDSPPVQNPPAQQSASPLVQNSPAVSPANSPAVSPARQSMENLVRDSRLTGSNSAVRKIDARLSPELGLGTGYLTSNIGMVVQVAALAPRAQEFQELKKTLEVKEGVLEGLMQQRQNAQPGSPERGELDGKIKDLQAEIEEVKTVKNDLLKDTAMGLGVGGASLAADVLGKVSTVASAAAAGATATSVLLVVSGAMGGLVAGVGTVLALVSLVDDGKVRKANQTESAKLLSELQSANVDPVVARLITLRLNHLEHVSTQNKIKTAQHGISFGACSAGLATGAVSATLGLTGTTVGVAGTVLLGATGVGAAVVGVGLVTTGVIYVAYKHRDEIDLFIKKKRATSELNSNLKAIDKNSKILTESQRELDITENKINTVNVRYNTRAAQLQQTYEQYETQINTIAQDPSLGAAQKATKIKELKQLQHTASNQLQSLKSRALSILEGENTKKTTLLKKVKISSQVILQKAPQVEALKDKVRILNERKGLASLSTNFNGVSPDEIVNEAENLHQTFLSSPSSQEAVKNFLRSQGKLTDEFEAEPVASVFRYLIAA